MPLRNLWVVVDALHKCNEGDVVWYIDVGCSLNAESEEWEGLKKLSRKYNAIFF